MDLEKISINRERDRSLRLTEVQIINRDHGWNDAQGVIVKCHDDGTITLGDIVSWRDPLPGVGAVDQCD